MQQMTLDEIYAEYGKLSLAYSQLATENHRLKQQIASLTKPPAGDSNGTGAAETAQVSA